MDCSNIFPGYNTVKEYSDAVLQAALSCSKATTEIDHDTYEYGCTFKGFLEAMHKERKILLSLIEGLVPGQKLPFDSIDEDLQIDFLKDINSSIFENVSRLLDETDGKKQPDVELVVTSKHRMPISTSWNKKYHNVAKNKMNTFSLISAKNIARPQFAFKTKVDNSNSIFVPIIKEKPNAIRPLSIVLEKDDEGKEEFSHPYETELEKFEPQPELLVIREPIVPKPLQETLLTYIDTEESLKALCEELKTQKEMAVDMEHHSYRSFQGFTCLLQISTREKDYIIDCLSLRSELWILNEVFTDPKIVKVFHGADMDILWLQRDFGLYVVNMFDTGQAARVLNFAHLSLSYLMKHYCNIEPDKQFQLADWRIRPLPEELLKYAREDTHYLLYIHDCMRNELIRRGNKLNNLLCSVYQRSKEICLKKYKKLVCTEDRYLELYRKCRRNFNPRQLFCLKELFMWRDKVARVEDESYGYILPNHMLLKICEVLPRDHQGILACCSPTPPFVQHHLNDLYSIVSKAHNYSLSQLEEPRNTVQPSEIRMNVDLNNILQCPHDIHSYDDTRMHFKHFSENASSTVHDSRQVLVSVKSAPSLSFGVSSVAESDAVAHKKDAIGEKIKRLNKTFYERLLLTQEYHASVGIDQDQDPVQKEKHSKSYIVEQPVMVTTHLSHNLPVIEVVEHGETTHLSGDPSHNLPVIEVLEREESQASSEEIHMVEDNLPSSESHEVLSRRKGKKRKKNKVRVEEESQHSTTLTFFPQRKKSKTPDSAFVSTTKVFHPFDYSKASSDSPKNISGRPLIHSFKPGQEMPNFKTGGKQNFRQKRGKQGTFSSSKTNYGSRNWPKN